MKDITIELLKEYNLVLQDQILELKSRILSNTIDIKEASNKTDVLGNTLNKLKESIEWLDKLEDQ